MSQNVEFILSLEDKQFTASIDRAGKLLTKFGERATKPAQKIKNLERSLGSVSSILGALETRLNSTADKLQDAAAGFELVSNTSRKAQRELSAISTDLRTFTDRVDSATSSTHKFWPHCGRFSRNSMSFLIGLNTQETMPVNSTLRSRVPLLLLVE